MNKFDRWAYKHPLIFMLTLIVVYLFFGSLVQRPSSSLEWWELFQASLTFPILVGVPLLIPATWSYLKSFIICLSTLTLCLSVYNFFIIRVANDVADFMLYVVISLFFSLILLIFIFLERNRKKPVDENN